MPSSPRASSKDLLEEAIAQIKHKHGPGSIMRLGDEERVPVEVIDSGSLALNKALGIGGLPRGRIVEIYGPESSGKTSLALHAAASVQKAGGRVAMIDAEHAFDPNWAETLGVDVGEGRVHYESGAMLISQPDTGEQGLEITDTLVGSGGVALIIIDSVAALVPRAEIEGEMGDSHVGLQARLMSQALRKLTGRAHETKTTVIFINQLREKIGIMFGNPETTTGGKALKFYASIRLDVRRIETLKDGADVTGYRARVKVVKNKMAPPFRTAEFDFMAGEGISRAREVIDMGVTAGVVRKSGAWYNYGPLQIGQGKDKAAQYLKENPEVAAEIEAKILAGVPVPAPPRAPVEPVPWEDTVPAAT